MLKRNTTYGENNFLSYITGDSAEITEKPARSINKVFNLLQFIMHTLVTKIFLLGINLYKKIGNSIQTEYIIFSK